MVFDLVCRTEALMDICWDRSYLWRIWKDRPGLNIRANKLWEESRGSWVFPCTRRQCGRAVVKWTWSRVAECIQGLESYLLFVVPKLGYHKPVDFEPMSGRAFYGPADCGYRMMIVWRNPTSYLLYTRLTALAVQDGGWSRILQLETHYNWKIFIVMIFVIQIKIKKLNPCVKKEAIFFGLAI